MSPRRHDDEPLDELAVTRDDMALDAFARDGGSWDGDPALRVLMALRDDVGTDLRTDLATDLTTDLTTEPRPAPGLSWAEAPTLQLAPADVRRTRPRGRLRNRTLVGGVIAAAVLSASGVAAAGIASGPGAPLYPIHKLILGDSPTASQRAAVQVRRLLGVAGGDLDAGRLPAAGSALTQASSWLVRVHGHDRGSLPAQLATMQARYAAAVAAGHSGPSSGPTGNAGPGSGTDEHGGGHSGPGNGGSGEAPGHGNDDNGGSGHGGSGHGSGDNGGGSDDHGAGSHGNPGGGSGGGDDAQSSADQGSSQGSASGHDGGAGDQDSHGSDSHGSGGQARSEG